MKTVLEPHEIRALGAVVAEELAKSLAPRLTALETAVSRALSMMSAKPQALPGPRAVAAASADCEMISLREVKRLTGLSESSIWRHEKKLRTFPSRRKLSSRRVAWMRSEVLAWIESRQAACPQPS